MAAPKRQRAPSPPAEPQRPSGAAEIATPTRRAPHPRKQMARRLAPPPTPLVAGGAPALPPPSPRGSATPQPPSRLADRTPVRYEPVPAVTRTAVALRGVTKIYPNGKAALQDVDLLIPEGDFVFLVGPSGAGKSTLIKLLIREERHTRGVIFVGGQDVSILRDGDVPRHRRRIGTVFQDYKLLPTKTVRENVAFALEVTGRPRREIGPAVDRALGLVGLTRQADQRPETLSGGERQRTAIARAMVHDPDLVIADEPTGNLDPLISWEIIELLLRINELGRTVLMATHDAEIVSALRRRVVALDGGRIVRDEQGGRYERPA